MANLWQELIHTGSNRLILALDREAAIRSRFSEYRVSWNRGRIVAIVDYQSGLLFDEADDRQGPPMESLNLPDADVVLCRQCFDPDTADSLFLQLRKEIVWEQEEAVYYGKKIPLPRLTAWFGDPGARYTYSNIINDPNPWIPVLVDIRERVQEAAGVQFNSVLLNLYRSERDGVAWHQDDESELGRNPVIASVNFGATRIFQMRHKFKTDAPKVDIPLPHGSLLLMRGGSQHFWRHQIPKTAKPCGERINLTFRFIYTSQ